MNLKTHHLVCINGYWHLRYMSKGKAVKKALHTTSMERAMALRDGMMDVLYGFAEAPRTEMTLDKCLDIWKKDGMRRRSSDVTEKLHIVHWQEFRDWMELHGYGFDDLKNRVVMEYLGWLRERGTAMNTYNKKVLSLKKVMESVCRVCDVDNVFSRVEHQQEDSVVKQAFTADELDAIFDSDDTEFRLLCGIGLYATLRLSDARTLKWSQIRDGYIDVIHGKTKAVATMRIPSALNEMLEEVPEGERTGYVCKTYAEMKLPTLSKMIQRKLNELGIETQVQNGSRKACVKGFHSLRHTGITLALKNGATVASVKRLAGHVSERMQERYTHLGADVAGDAGDRISW